MKPKPLKYFTDRIGKRIYRDDIGCCDSCKYTTKNGLFISNKQHAQYVHLVAMEMGIEYRDKK